jgi:hypothetical protein
MDDPTVPSSPSPSSRIEEILGCSWQDYIEADLAARRMELDAEVERGIKALLLSSSIEICRALLRGERVPWMRLDYFQAERYGLRRRRSDGRYGLDDFNDVRSPV